MHRADKLNLSERQRLVSMKEKWLPEVRRQHSRKPDAQYEYLEQLCPRAVRFVELFARQNGRPGWSAWGRSSRAITSIWSRSPSRLRTKNKGTVAQRKQDELRADLATSEYAVIEIIDDGEATYWFRQPEGEYAEVRDWSDDEDAEAYETAFDLTHVGLIGRRWETIEDFDAEQRELADA